MWFGAKLKISFHQSMLLLLLLLLLFTSSSCRVLFTNFKKKKMFILILLVRRSSLWFTCRFPQTGVDFFLFFYFYSPSRRYTLAVGRTVAHRVSVRLHHLHGLLLRSPLTAGRSPQWTGTLTSGNQVLLFLSVLCFCLSVCL